LQKQKTALVYTTALTALAVLLFAAFFLNLLPWTSGAPVDGKTLIEEQPLPAYPPEDDTPAPEPEEPEDAPLFEGDINRLPLEMIVDMLSFIISPIEGAHIGMTAGQLPGAPRNYRNGTHEGVDYYNGFCGVTILRGVPVLAAADGVVIRIDHTYEEMTEEERVEYRRISAQSPTTPEDILDKFRGRQVWLEHQENVISRYAHLDTVSSELAVGDTINAGEQIGTVGNSGTPPAITGGAGEMHLHFEIWVNEYYLGKGLPPADVRFLLRSILE
jgi:murein DD-endopeptidase MepM/ murein hydrolase activator NlpD